MIRTVSSLGQRSCGTCWLSEARQIGLFPRRVSDSANSHRLILDEACRFFGKTIPSKPGEAVYLFASRQFQVAINTNLYLRLFPKLSFFFHYLHRPPLWWMRSHLEASRDEGCWVNTVKLIFFPAKLSHLILKLSWTFVAQGLPFPLPLSSPLLSSFPFPFPSHRLLFMAQSS